MAIVLNGTTGITSDIDSDESLTLNRDTTDGGIITFQKDGTTVGSIGTLNSDLTIGSSGAGLRMFNGNGALTPFDVNTNSNLDGTLSLGYTNQRFKDLYLSGGVYLGGTGSANKLDDYEEGTFTPEFRDGESGNIATCAVANGHYTKIGQMVRVSVTLGNIDTTGLTSSSYIRITGLPFVCNSDGATGAVWADSIAFTDMMVSSRANSFASLQVYSIRNGSTDTQLRVDAVQNSSADFSTTLIYHTDS
jgi:hypothetical protein